VTEGTLHALAVSAPGDPAKARGASRQMTVDVSDASRARVVGLKSMRISVFAGRRGARPESSDVEQFETIHTYIHYCLV
jgi:hypothetical protein